ncbi:unnamed protein product [Fraxinus pennsylvanica]|uniref:Uncharacterized protein n=1 Tax=Fraxinus pennsylvanica TaxID=56036 RepID=A0AAD2E7D5_9LAMI|nr:unnamed protein product [Fraxinus pennsylvanica]
MACSSETTTDKSGFRFSDIDSDDNYTWQSSASTAAADGWPKKYSISKRAKVVRQKFNCPVNSDSEEIDLESGELEQTIQNNLEERRVIRDSRICKLSSQENVNCDPSRGDKEFNGILIGMAMKRI